ncbi:MULTISPECIES: cytochrome-c peroxidase [Sphingobacterium]|uniref:cytochrome-c peroxidase n=1 Tax=Sphingobacterium TaxID=28453 RepID=UPI0013D959FD|nr:MULTISPECIES: cytochrome c peroxidase [unclassified Sphingobacterium]
MYKAHSFFWGIMTLLWISCSKSTPDPKPVDPYEEDNRKLRERYSTTTANWPKAEWYTGISQRELAELPVNPSSARPELIQLGKVLFFDNRLGRGDNSCASCHNPNTHWIDQKKVAVGVGVHHRNTPTMENVWYLDGGLFHDGRADTYAEQIAEAIESPIEMGGNLESLPWALQLISGYGVMFKQAYGDEQITKERILDALTAFSKSINSSTTIFDSFLKGEYTALSDEQLRGLHLFRTKGKCINCHNGPFFTDLQYHNLGYALDWNGKLDNGRYEATKLEVDLGKFRTPGLRNTVHTAPYWHNGEIATLAEILDLKNRGMPHSGRQKVNGQLSNLAQPLQLTTEEQQAIIAFLRTLSSKTTEISRPVLP